MGGTGIELEAIDGVELSWVHDAAELLPGRHVVRASLVLRGGLSKQVHQFEVPFEAQAGRKYTLLGEQSAHGPRMWIADEDFHTVAEVDRGMIPAVSSRERANTRRR